MPAEVCPESIPDSALIGDIGLAGEGLALNLIAVACSDLGPRHGPPSSHLNRKI